MKVDVKTKEEIKLISNGRAGNACGVDSQFDNSYLIKEAPTTAMSPLGLELIPSIQ